MDRAQIHRWSVLLSALALTIGAIAYPTEDPLSDSSRTGQPAARPQVAKPILTSVAMKVETRAPWVASDEDPFAPRGWVAPPPAPVQQQAVEPVVVAEAAPPPPPPLPFKFLGQMSDNGDRVIYLKMGEQVLLARAGETFEGSYKVVAISASQIEFEMAGSGVRQSLPIPAQDN